MKEDKQTNKQTTTTTTTTTTKPAFKDLKLDNWGHSHVICEITSSNLGEGSPRYFLSVNKFFNDGVQKAHSQAETFNSLREAHH